MHECSVSKKEAQHLREIYVCPPTLKKLARTLSIKEKSVQIAQYFVLRCQPRQKPEVSPEAF